MVIPMAEVQKFRLSICGSEYTISTDEPAGYMQELAAQVDASMRNLLNSNERITLVQAAILTALMNADTAHKQEASAENLRDQMKDFISENARARQEADTARREAVRLRGEADELRRQLAARS